MRNGLIQRAETFAKGWRDFEASSPENAAMAREIAGLVLKLREQSENDRDYSALRTMLTSHQEALGLNLQNKRCFRLWFESIAFHLIQE